jgi:hypothetical protein
MVRELRRDDARCAYALRAHGCRHGLGSEHDGPSSRTRQRALVAVLPRRDRRERDLVVSKHRKSEARFSTSTGLGIQPPSARISSSVTVSCRCSKVPRQWQHRTRTKGTRSGDLERTSWLPTSTRLSSKPCSTTSPSLRSRHGRSRVTERNPFAHRTGTPIPRRMLS